MQRPSGINPYTAIQRLFQQFRAWVSGIFKHSRRRIVSFLLGQTVAMRLANKYLGVGSPNWSGEFDVFRIGRKTVLKLASRPTEAITMRYVAQNTRIPIPEVYDYWEVDQSQTVILMEYMESAGTLKKRWKSLSDDAKTRIAQQMHRYINELRALEQPPGMDGYIGPVDGAPLYDCRVKMTPVGPFRSEKEFNLFRLALLSHLSLDPDLKEQIDDLRSRLREDHRIVFTHGDLNDRNILLDDEDNVVALLDWEMSGWMPEYWEYTKAIHGRWEKPRWIDFARRAVPVHQVDMGLDDQYIIINGGAPF